MHVECYEEKIVMPTYRVLGEDPLPRFFDGYYPYTGLNRFDDKPVPVSYDTIVVENEFLKMRVIPSLGARLYDLFDKVNGAHVFHYNETVRPAMIALRGAWISTGMEFNSVHRPHHTVDNFSPVDYKVEKDLDGSITVTIGNHNLLTGIYWSVGLTLRPERQFLETTVRTFNGDPLRSKYYFWTNSSESVSEASRVFIPGKRTQSGTFPISDGVDVSWYKNCKFPVDAFIIDSEEDFFGYYDYGTDLGVAHYANHHIVPGKKRFTWGTSEDGLFWAPILSDRGIPYIELQSGRFRTQSIVEFIDPHFSEEWKEWWYPIAKIGGITFANKEATIHLERKKRRTFVGVYVTGIFPKAKIRIEGSKGSFEETFDLSPANPFLKNYESEITKVEVLTKDGGEIASWDSREYKTKVDETVFAAPIELSTSAVESLGKNIEKLLVDAELEDKRGDRILAELKYRRIIDLDGHNSKALSSLAAIHYRRAEYDGAIGLLRKAVERNPSCEWSHYLLGLAYLKNGDCDDAEVEFWKARRTQRYFAPACYHLALIKMKKKRYRESEEILSEGIGKSSRDARSLFLYAATLRRQGKLAEAFDAARRALEVSPLYYPAISEAMMCSKGTEKFSEAKLEFKRIVGGKEQKVLEVAKEYIGAELYEDAAEILIMALQDQVDAAMIHYYLGFVYEKAGKSCESNMEYSIANTKSPDYVFPHRAEEEEILRSAKNATGDPRPSYYLGNLLFSLGRFEEAVKEWEEAKRRGMHYWVLYRNLGYAHYLLHRAGRKALREYEEAIRLNPLDPGLYEEYDEVCSYLGLTGRRIDVLKDAKEKVKKDSILARLASAYVEAERYDEALEILERNTFTPAEGYHRYWDIYVEALVRRGASKMMNGKFEEALVDFEKSLQYPSNLGVGAPYFPNRHEAVQRYWLGECYNSLGMKGKAWKIWNGVISQKLLTPLETYYMALALEKMGRKREATRVLKDTIGSASKIECAILGLKSKLHPIHFHYLGYDLKLAKQNCIKMVAYLGLGRKKQAAVELGRAMSSTKDLGHCGWIYKFMKRKRARSYCNSIVKGHLVSKSIGMRSPKNKHR